MNLNEIREAYLSFFEKKLHTRMPSASLIPQNDKSLLIINSGMAPLKPYFIGKETPPNLRLTTCQKCIRTGDIENVGKTQRHGTFFEMLGNFSFGEYFKKEATAWALEFCLEVLKLPKDSIYFSIYEEDEETALIWESLGIPKEKIVRLGKDDNFWEVGTGPCGPCSELYYDRGKKYGCGSDTCAPGCDCDRFLEFWNLVFTQFNKEENGTYSDLSNKNIDTGMGLERMAVIMQEVSSIFDVDTMQNIISKITELSNQKYNEHEQKDISIRIITDHIRSITFMLSDGILPSNEGRGYVLRRLLRRAVRHGKKLGIKGDFLEKVSAVVVENSKTAYPELEQKQNIIFKYLNIEEEAFNKTIDQGLLMIEKLTSEKENEVTKKAISGEDAFKMYDTYGFPLELLTEIAEEKGFSVDKDSYERHMQAQRERARNARSASNFLEGDIFENIQATEFLGYNNFKLEATVLHVSKDEKNEKNIKIILNKTPFYAESGGQIGDSGLIISNTGSNNATIEITKTVKSGDKIIHIGTLLKGELKAGDLVTAEVYQSERKKISRNHTAAHLLHKALKDVLGEDANQAGSEVSSKKLRFDFTHFEAVTAEQLEKIENIVNRLILQAHPVIIEEKPIEEAKKEGAIALFGEKYGDFVRVVKMGASIELCGGTHLTNTSEVCMFKIISESSIAQGVRRIEAISGLEVVDYTREKEAKLKEIENTLKASGDNALKKINTLLEENKTLAEKAFNFECRFNMERYYSKLVSSKIEINETPAIIYRIDGISSDIMLFLADIICKEWESLVAILIGDCEGKVNIVVTATSDLVKKGINAGNIAREMSKATGGGGGGKPNRAIAGGKDTTKIDESLELARDLLYLPQVGEKK
ncbi:MAG: alanine--tRNA ligase [Defluviitaleaceae bacterium]|nr:alanine--tRNA ligase [Defluviitaleaceae bacterium]